MTTQSESVQPAPAEVENLRKALQFYAEGQHFIKSEEDAWDTVSGEPQNYWCDEAGTATVEDGSIARLALSGHQINFEDEEQSAPAVGAGGVPIGPVGLDWLISDIRKLPTVRAAEFDGEESDGTPRHYRGRPHVSLTQLERLLREFFKPAPTDAAAPPLPAAPLPAPHSWPMEEQPDGALNVVDPADMGLAPLPAAKGQEPADATVKAAKLWYALMDQPGARRRVWNHVLDEDVREKGNSIEEVLLAALSSQQPTEQGE